MKTLTLITALLLSITLYSQNDTIKTTGLFDGMVTGLLTEKIEYRYDTIPVYILMGYDECPDDGLCGSVYMYPYTFTNRGYIVNKRRKYNNGTYMFEYISNPVAILSYEKKERLDNDPHYIIWSTQPRKLSK